MSTKTSLDWRENNELVIEPVELSVGSTAGGSTAETHAGHFKSGWEKAESHASQQRLNYATQGANANPHKAGSSEHHSWHAGYTAHGIHAKQTGTKAGGW